MAPAANLETVSIHAELLPIEIWSRSGPDMSYMVKKPGCVMISNASLFATIQTEEQTPPLIRKQESIWQPFAGFVSPLLKRGDLFATEEHLSRVHGTTVTQTEWNVPPDHMMISITMEPFITADAIGGRTYQRGLWFDPQYGRKYTFDRATGRLVSVLVFTEANGERIALFETDSIEYEAVSYTHLTLPTKRIV